MDGRWEVRCSAVGGKGRGRRKEATEIPRRTANERLRDSKDLPKVVIASDETSMAHLGGPRLLIAPPLLYDEIMKTVLYGSVTTSEHIRSLLAQRHGADATCQLTAGIFITIVAQASDEREHDKTPFWRPLKKAGELNPRYPWRNRAAKGQA